MDQASKLSRGNTMRPEISNELLLRVIQAWDPAKADKWNVNEDSGNLRCDGYGVRFTGGVTLTYNTEGHAWHKASKLVEFLLKDRPNLELDDFSTPYEECMKACDGGHWYRCDPWSGETVPPNVMVARIKSYEYLKAWKENQEARKPLPPEVLIDACDQKVHTELGIGRAAQTARSKRRVIDPSDVVLLIDGQAIEGMEIYDDTLGAPATYEKICPHCNGSKEVVGWLGKETCNVCR